MDIARSVNDGGGAVVLRLGKQYTIRFFILKTLFSTKKFHVFFNRRLNFTLPHPSLTFRAIFHVFLPEQQEAVLKTARQ